jgi:hypothetical protein
MYFSRVLKLTLALSLLALMLPVTAVMGQTTGTATFADSSAGKSDKLVVSMNDMPPLGASEVYQGWLVSDDGKTNVDVGVLTVAADSSIIHTFTSATGTNLAAANDTFTVTIEATGGATSPSKVVAFTATIAEDAMTHIRHLLVSNAGNQGITPGLYAQTNAALTQAEAAANATSLSDIQAAAGNAINIIEGSGGANFDASRTESGDSYGVLNYAADAKTHAKNITTAFPKDAKFFKYEPNVSDSADNVATLAGSARDNALLAVGATDATSARAYATNVQTNLERALSGYDADRDGSIAAGGSEGGALQAHQNAQNMASFSPAAGTGLPVAGDIGIGSFAWMVLMMGIALVSAGSLIRMRKTVSK